MLLCHAWDSDEPGVLPDDDAALSAFSGLNSKRWAKCREAISRAFLIEGGKWKQERMIEEREAQRTRFQQAELGGVLTASSMSPEQRSDRARKAARSRWQRC